MGIEQRPGLIVSTLVENGRGRIKDLLRNFGVLEETLCHDLDILSARAFLQKTHGGAIDLDVPCIGGVVRSMIAGRVPDAQS